MNEHQYEDLVQLIKASDSNLGSRIQATEDRLTERLDRLDLKVDGGFAAMDEAIENLGTQADADKAAIEHRLAEHDRILLDHTSALDRLKPNAA